MLQFPEIPNILIYSIFFVDFFIFFMFFLYFIRTKISFKDIKSKIKYRDITFVVSAYNEEKNIERTIDSIKKCNYPQERIKIIIIDDGSKDNTLNVAKRLEEKYYGIKVYTKKNSGKADTLNFGLKKARTELVAVLDADTILKSDIIEKAVIKFGDRNIAAVTVKYKPVSVGNFWERMQNIEYSFASFKRNLMESVHALPIAPAFTIFVRDFFVKNGYFDKDNLTEDFEMGLRINERGYSIGYVKDSYAYTDVPNTLKSLYRQRIRWNYGTIYNYIKYSKMFFNRKYGDLGVFVFPVWVMGLFFTSFILLLSMYNLIVYGMKYIDLLSNGWMPNFNFNVEGIYFGLTNMPFLLFSASIFLALVSFFLVKSEIDNEIKLFDYFLMLIAYLWILALFCLVSVAKYFLGRKPKW